LASAMPGPDLLEYHYGDALGFALLAFKLSVLSFYLGVLIYALPIPWAPLKRWAPRLIGEGILGAALSLGFAVFIYGTFRLGLMLGASWDSFLVWVLEQIGLIMAIQGAIKALLLAYNKLAGVGLIFPKLLAAAEFLDKTIPVILGVLMLMASFTYILLVAGGKLLGLGLALYTAPFGVTRAVGSWLIAFYIVFMIGLPLYPLFLGLISGAIEPGEPGDGVAVVNVSGQSGPLQWGVVEFVGRDGRILAGYEIINGVALSGEANMPLVVVPEEASYVRVRYMDAIFTPENAGLDGKARFEAINIELPWATWNPHQGVLLYATQPAASFEAGPERVKARYLLGPGDYVELAVLEGCVVDYRLLEAPPNTASETREFSFAGLKGRGYRFTPPNGGEIVLEARLEECTWSGARGAAKDYPNYYERRLAYEAIAKYWDPEYIASLIIVYLVAPSAYIAMLFGATAGLAKVLGGSWKIPLRLK